MTMRTLEDFRIAVFNLSKGMMGPAPASCLVDPSRGEPDVRRGDMGQQRREGSIPAFSRRNAVAALLAAFLATVPTTQLLAQSSRIEFRMVDQSMSVERALETSPPPGSEILYDISDQRPYLVEKRVLLSGADMCDAEAAFLTHTGEPMVSFRFGADGTRRFAEVTQNNVGRPMAIVLDGKVASAPVIREPILGGAGQISGKLSTTQVNDLANWIKANASGKCQL